MSADPAVRDADELPTFTDILCGLRGELHALRLELRVLADRLDRLERGEGDRERA